MHSASHPDRGSDQRQGLRYWMRRVLAEWRKASSTFEPDTVHDLRVALRRCRSMADALMEIDPDPAWGVMKKAGRRAFRRLGDLRDTQVMLGWLSKLAPEGDTTAAQLSQSLAQREAHHIARAAKALRKFNRSEWKAWTRELGQKAEKPAPCNLLFHQIALERCLEAHALHQRALHNRSRASWHALRIGIKRFRYVIENFLPEQHQAWGADLKRAQDLLGEVHDFDVLWSELRSTGKTFGPAERERWQKILERERGERISAYRAMTLGEHSLWKVWRAGLPSGQDLESAALCKIKSWAAYRDPKPAHTEQVARLAVNLFDELARCGLPGPYREPRWRYLLRAAALMHNVGLSTGRRAHHKATQKLIVNMKLPAGWTEEELSIAALVARYHRGGAPSDRHRVFAALDPLRREFVVHLGGILRLAAAFLAYPQCRVRKLRVKDQPETLFLFALGYQDQEPLASYLAAERHLLERALRKPIVIQPTPAEPKRLYPAPAEVASVAD